MNALRLAAGIVAAVLMGAPAGSPGRAEAAPAAVGVNNIFVNAFVNAYPTSFGGPEKTIPGTSATIILSVSRAFEGAPWTGFVASFDTNGTMLWFASGIPYDVYLGDANGDGIPDYASLGFQTPTTPQDGYFRTCHLIISTDYAGMGKHVWAIYYRNNVPGKPYGPDPLFAHVGFTSGTIILN